MLEDTTKKIIFDETQATTIKVNWFSRTFGKMENDSLRSTIFLMMAGTLGAGIYTLHHMFDELGIVWSILLLIFSCISAILALDIYIHASKVTGEPSSFAEINIRLLGKNFNYFANGVTGVLLYLVLIGFTVCISKIAFQVIKGPVADILEVDIDDNDFYMYHKPTCIIIAIMSFFLIVPKNVDKLSMLSLYCFLIHFYIIIVIIYQSPSHFNQLEEDEKTEFNFSTFDAKGLFLNFGLAIGVFNTVPSFLMARNLVRNPSKDRLRKIFGRACWILLVIYIITSICGYMSIGHFKASDVDLMVFRPGSGETDYLMNIGQFLLAFSLAITYSLIGYALKMIILPLFPGNEALKHISISITILATSSFIAMNFDSVTKYISLAGSFAGTFISIIFPGLLALKSGYSKDKFVNMGIKLWIIVSAITGAASTYYTFIEIINSKEHE